MHYSLSNGKRTKHGIQSWMYGFLVVPILVLAIFQDYVYSVLKDTGFHLSESVLYNTIWVFLVPISLLDVFLQKKVALKSIGFRITWSVIVSVGLTLLHIAVFTSFFTAISHLAYTTPHRFAHMFSTALSNQSYILIFFYLVIPYLFQLINRKKMEETSETAKKIVVREGVKRILLDIESIVYIESNKPYSVVHTMDKKYLCDENLKKLEKKLNSTFLRVHRSFIINRDCVTSIASRKNGDYDAHLANEEWVRMSRHLRQNWESLLR